MKIVKPGDPEIAVSGKRTEAERKRAFRQREGDRIRDYDRSRKRQSRAAAIPEFIGVDCEGIGKGKNHRAVLLGVGEKQHIAHDTERGLQWKEAFEFLYAQFEAKPKAAFVGFFLTYDFNSILRTLPEKAARMLLTPQGKVMRKRRDNKGQHYFPVRNDGWEFDMLGYKRLSIRPWCGCIPEAGKTCEHDEMPWMHICDAGPFFQMPFAKVIEPEMWKDDPGGDIASPAQRRLIEAGKNRRSYADLDEEMMLYNRLENVLLAQVMQRLAKGFKSVGINLSRNQWYGPGASAAKWLQLNKAPKKADLEGLGIPEWFSEICQQSYYGGWFEIFSHGLIYGESWNYDINNAYPYATSKLPHICGDGRVSRGNGKYQGSGKYVLVYATVYGKSTRIGPVPYRDKSGNILRPDVAKGWYWLSELDASRRARLVRQIRYHEWAEFIPCGHDNPFGDVRTMYDLRLSVGKSSAQGLAIKLTNNSLYGKFAQNVGSAPFGNWFYSSYITSHCRTQILDAIASHPGRENSVLMVATDGVCFDSRHPGMAISKSLGEWEESKYDDLCLFKPGVYWHKSGKEKLLKIKSRGVPKAAFQKEIEGVEALFGLMLTYGSHPQSPIFQQAIKDKFGNFIYNFSVESGWPKFTAKVSFRMKSCKQALNEGKWDSAGEVMESATIWQSSDPESKRRAPYYNSRKNRIDTEIHMLPYDDCETNYYHVPKEPVPDMGYTPNGDAIDPIIHAFSALRDDTKEGEWETIWDSTQ